MILKVTKTDIREGIPGDSCRCAVARSLKRYFKTDDVEVDDNFISVFDPNLDDYIEFIPIGRLQRFINDYDAGEYVSPIEGDLLCRLT